MQKYYQNKPIFDGVYSRNNLPKWKDGAHLDEYKSTGLHWIIFKVNDDNETYFDSLRVEHIPKKKCL